MIEVVFLNAHVEFNYSEWSISAPQLVHLKLRTRTYRQNCV